MGHVTLLGAQMLADPSESDYMSSSFENSNCALHKSRHFPLTGAAVPYAGSVAGFASANAQRVVAARALAGGDGTH
jgi:hypothetical protein